MNPRIAFYCRKLMRPVFGTSLRYNRSMEDVAIHFRQLGFSPGTIIDVGVYDGTYELYDTWPSSHMLLVEPLQECEKALKYICSHRIAPASYLLAAAGDREGEVEIDCTGDLSGASIVYGNSGRRVPMYRLDTICGMFDAVPPFLLKVDVQGAEAAVLAGAQALLRQCEVVMLETQLFDFGGSGITFVETVAYMKEHGFVPFDIYDGLCRPLDRSLGQIDVAFVQTDGRFRQEHSWGTAVQNSSRAQISRIRRALGI